MEFKEFAHILKPIIGGAYSTHAFTKTIFEAIINEKDLPLIEGTSESSFKAYYNGKTQITKISQVILPYVDPELFSDFLSAFPEATIKRLCDAFEEYIEDIDMYNATEKIAYYFESILQEAAAKKRKSTPKSAKNTKGKTPYDRINEKILKSGQAMADVLGQAMEQLADKIDSESSADDNPQKELDENTLTENDMAYLKELRTDVKPLLIYCIEHDPAGEATRITLADEINAFIDKWKFEVREIKDQTLRVLTNDIIKVLSEYTYYISDKFLRLLPTGKALWFRNESAEEGEQLKDVLQPESYKKRCEIRDLYLRLYPIPEDKEQRESNKTIIQHQTNVIQNGETNVNLTNTGTININL